MSTADALLKLIGSPDLCSKRWVWEQYDHVILGNTVQRPGGDAAVVRVDDGPKALALTTDVTPRYCEADPFEGGKQAVAEAWRNLTAVGAQPLALTDNLNFGNPERPEIMGQLVGCMRGIARGLHGARLPGRVRQRLALQRDQWPRRSCRRPTIGGVGLLDDFTQVGDARLQGRGRGDPADRRDRKAGSASRSICATSAAARRARRRRSISRPSAATATSCAALIRDGRRHRGARRAPTAASLVALAEMAMAGGIGAELDAPPGGIAAARLLVRRGSGALCRHGRRRAPPRRRACARARRPACRRGSIGVTGGDALTLPGERAILVAELRERFEGWLPGLHGRRRQRLCKREWRMRRRLATHGDAMRATRSSG